MYKFEYNKYVMYSVCFKNITLFIIITIFLKIYSHIKDFPKDVSQNLWPYSINIINHYIHFNIKFNIFCDILKYYLIPKGL